MEKLRNLVMSKRTSILSELRHVERSDNEVETSPTLRHIDIVIQIFPLLFIFFIRFFSNPLQIHFKKTVNEKLLSFIISKL